MHEDLLGYLLGALDPDEMQRVARLLREDPEAREQLAELEKMVRPLEEGYVPVEPPPGDLVSRTLANLPPASFLPLRRSRTQRNWSKEPVHRILLRGPSKLGGFGHGLPVVAWCRCTLQSTRAGVPGLTGSIGLAVLRLRRWFLLCCCPHLPKVVLSLERSPVRTSFDGSARP